MRSFIALEMPQEVKEHAAGVIRELKTSGADLKWVAPANLHLTLKFLGEVEQESLPGLIQAQEAACARARALELAVEGCGAFPGLKSPKVVWLGLGGQVAKLAQLAGALGEAFEPLGFAPEKRAFKPHLTLGRLRRGRRGQKPPPTGPLTRTLAGLAGEKGPIFVARHVVLMKSTLTPQGAIYDPLHRTALA
jgi:RNA 2',3'-cyclic 3'-phosphodiesterase